MGQELESNADTFNAAAKESDSFALIEPTLVKLNAFINMKVKYSDFNAADKANLVELFVTHQKTLMHIYMSIFHVA